MTVNYRTDPEFAREMDSADPLASYRQEFYIPQAENGQPSIYLCGNSLGLQPKGVKEALNQELDDWAKWGVEGHFHKDKKHPWMPYHEFLTQNAASLVGAKPVEVVTMNSLSVNINLLMVSFYRPTPERHKIVIEGNAFPSDRYAVEAQIKFHGFDPETSLIELTPRPGEVTLRTEDIEAVINAEGSSIALIMMGGVNYYTGQFFDLERITKAGHARGCIVGFDLAHAAGNVPLKLHDWGVDFACWCSYKYLNSGPGSIAGCFVHERHANAPDLPRFVGWWAQRKDIRFRMGPDFNLLPGAEGWQMSNPPIFALVPVRVSLDIFNSVGMEKLREKSLKLTGYLEFLLDSLCSDAFKSITPRDPSQRGCQISIVVRENGRAVYEALQKAGVICDWREPDCIRIAPVPLYNSFDDVYRFVKIFAHALGLDLGAGGQKATGTGQ